MDKVGVWINQREAYIVRVNGRGEVQTEHVDSSVEHNHKSMGGHFAASPNASKGGSGRLELKLHERREHEFAHFFKDIMARLSKMDTLVILGPGPTKFKLAKAVSDKKSLSQKIESVLSTDKMTQNQIIAKVLNYYQMSRPRKKITRSRQLT